MVPGSQSGPVFLYVHLDEVYLGNSRLVPQRVFVSVSRLLTMSLSDDVLVCTQPVPHWEKRDEERSRSRRHWKLTPGVFLWLLRLSQKKTTWSGKITSAGSFFVILISSEDTYVITFRDSCTHLQHTWTEGGWMCLVMMSQYGIAWSKSAENLTWWIWFCL